MACVDAEAVRGDCNACVDAEAVRGDCNACVRWIDRHRTPCSRRRGGPPYGGSVGGGAAPSHRIRRSSRMHPCDTCGGLGANRIEPTRRGGRACGGDRGDR